MVESDMSSLWHVQKQYCRALVGIVSSGMRIQLNSVGCSHAALERGATRDFTCECSCVGPRRVHALVMHACSAPLSCDSDFDFDRD